MSASRQRPETDRPLLARPNSRLVGLHHSLLRQQLDHFFPDATLQLEGDRSAIHWETEPGRPNYALDDDPDGLGVLIDWFGSRYLFMPASPVPFLESEKRLIHTILRVLDLRFQALVGTKPADQTELFGYAIEDTIITEYLNPPGPTRVTAALEAMRVAALSTYEDRRVSSGALLLGTDEDPGFPERTNAPGAQRYNVRLTALKSIHRLCDGLRTVFVVDRRGDMAWAVDIGAWSRRVHGSTRLPVPNPRRYEAHARATVAGGHVAMVLSPSQEIKVLAKGTIAFAFSNARWRLIDIPAKFEAWTKALGERAKPGLAEQVSRAALNLCERRIGGLIVVVKNPEESIPSLVAPGDRIDAPEPSDLSSEGADHLPPRMAKRALHRLVYTRDVGELDASLLESLAGIDGAVVMDTQGRLTAFGAILRITPDAILAARAAEGARTVAALTASYHGPVLKVSQDGLMSMYLGGRRVWEL